MPDQSDFEQAWLAKLVRSLDTVTGEDIRRSVMEGCDGLSSSSERADVIAWTQQAMARLEARVHDEAQRRAVMTGCACEYPRSSLLKIRQEYLASGDIGVAHGLLQEQFEDLLRNGLGLDEAMVEDIVARGWGAAGMRQGNKIIATKIPKSGYLVEYMQESDPERKRQLYCHCPRVRDALKTADMLSPTYCYCGAGFYKGIWETILQEPVEVELLSSVLQGDDVCSIAIHLPPADTH